ISSPCRERTLPSAVARSAAGSLALLVRATRTRAAVGVHRARRVRLAAALAVHAGRAGQHVAVEAVGARAAVEGRVAMTVGARARATLGGAGACRVLAQTARRLRVAPTEL